jgi:hypothetical protein
MAKKAIAGVATLVRDHSERDALTSEAPERTWRERALSEEELFQGTDEAGRTGWFLRLTLTGMYPRRIGPYDSKEEALAVSEAVIAEFVMDSMTDILNDVERGQVCILEGVPRLAATMTGE